MPADRSLIQDSDVSRAVSRPFAFIRGRWCRRRAWKYEAQREAFRDALVDHWREANRRNVEDIDKHREALREYASHQSWRCDHPDRYSHDPDCPCGAVSTLRELGLDPAKYLGPAANA